MKSFCETSSTGFESEQRLFYIYLPRMLTTLLYQSPWKLRNILRKLLPRYVALHVSGFNFRMCVDMKDEGVSSHIYFNGIYENAITEIFFSYLKTGMSVLDVGANIGYFSLIASEIVGESGHVFSFEPNPRNFLLLKHNININGFRNVSIEQKAVWNEDSQIRLYLDPEADSQNIASGGHSIVATGKKRKFVKVESIQLDSFLKNDVVVDFIKMDIEGAEAVALNGMDRILKKNENVVLVTEILPYALKAAGTPAETYFKQLADLGFKLHIIEKGLESADIKTLNAFVEELENDQNRQYPHFNLLCKRSTI